MCENQLRAQSGSFYKLSFYMVMGTLELVSKVLSSSVCHVLSGINTYHVENILNGTVIINFSRCH